MDNEQIMMDIYGRFSFHHAVWHWGNNSKEGSEHYLNGVQYPMEVQLFHWDTKYFDYDIASTKSDGLAAVSLMYEISEEPNLQLQDLIEATKRLEDEASHMGIEFEVPLSKGASLDKLLPEGGLANSDNYFYYEGSLTLPRNSNTTDAEDCSETVLWIVFEKKIPISESQLKAMRSLLKFASADFAAQNPSLCSDEVCATQTTSLQKQLRGCICAEDLMCVHNFRPIHALNPSVTATRLNRMNTICYPLDKILKTFLLFKAKSQKASINILVSFRSELSKDSELQTIFPS